MTAAFPGVLNHEDTKRGEALKYRLSRVIVMFFLKL
jgi:hypothetical protein